MMQTFERFWWDGVRPFIAAWQRIIRRLFKWQRCFICRERWGERYLFIFSAESTTTVWLCMPCMRSTFREFSRREMEMNE